MLQADIVADVSIAISIGIGDAAANLITTANSSADADANKVAITTSMLPITNRIATGASAQKGQER